MPATKTPANNQVCVPPSSISPGFSNADRRRSPGKPGNGSRSTQPIVLSAIPAKANGCNQDERKAISSAGMYRFKINSGKNEGETVIGASPKFGEVLLVKPYPSKVNAIPDKTMISGATIVTTAKDFLSLKESKSIRR